MSNINKAAVLNMLPGTVGNIVDYIPKATASKFGIVALGSGINVDSFGRIYLDTQEYSDRLAAIEAEAASTLATQKSEVAAAIAQVNLAQSQTITALTLEVSNLADSITATQADLIDRADQLAQDITDITEQLTQDKAAFTQEIQDALDYLKDDASVASALRTPRKIQTVPFDGTQDINLPVFTSEIDGLVPKRVGATTTKYLREDGTWEVPTDTTYPLLTKAKAEAGTDTTANAISAKVLKDAILHHTPIITDITGNAGTATKLQTPRAINGVLFDGTQDISLPDPPVYSLPAASASVLGGIKVGSGLDISNSVLSVGTLNQSTTGNAATATKLQTARTINDVSFDGSADITLPLASTSVSGTVQLNNTLTSTATDRALTAAQGKALNDTKLAKTENAVSATKLQTSRTISLTGGVTGSVSFDGRANATIATTVTGLGVANGIATLDSAGLVPSSQLPSYVDDVLEYLNVAAFPTTGELGKIYVETTGNTTYRWSGSGYTKITSGEVSSVAGKTGVVTLTKSDVGLANVDNTADSVKSVASAAKLTTARTIGGVFFDGTVDIDLPGVNTAGNQSTSGNAGSATKLQTARLINGIAFDGTGDINLDVYSKAETDSIAGTPNATETVEGKAKIATTAISREGTNDTDIITALKLKQTLEASKSVLAGSVNFNGTGTVSIRSQLNVSSITDFGIGKYRINMTTSMANANYPVFTSVANRGNGAANIGIEVKEQTADSITVQTFVTGTGAATDVNFISVGWTR